MASRASTTPAQPSVPTATELANGVACMAVAAATKAPAARPERPFTCSSRKGLRFWGMAELEPTSSSGSSRKANSAVVHSSTSAARRLAVTPSTAAAANSRSTTSRDATASRAWGAGRSKPSSAAVRAGAIGYAVTCPTPAPSGLVSRPADAAASDSKSRSTARATPPR